MWTALGLAVGTYVNWLLVARRLRVYSHIAGDAITLPDFFSNRFHEKKKVLMGIASIFILVFFTVYASSCFVTCGKLFSTLFGGEYHTMMILGALFVIVYTWIGGFLAESASDFMQAVVMVITLVMVLIVGTVNAGGIDVVIENAKAIPGYLSINHLATPETVDGVQQVVNGAPVFGEAANYSVLSMASMMAWGLGYFGMPQVLLRFMAIRKVGDLKLSRRVATAWCVVSLFAAIVIGFIGRALFPTALLTSSDAENIFITTATALLPTVLAGIAMAGILAATISSSDSYLLIAASAVSKNLYQGIVKKNATDKQVMRMSRIVLIVISVLGVAFAWNEDSVIFTIVSFAWAGFGATFGPLMLFSLFWKRTNRAGAIAGMVSGAVTVFLWKLVIKPLGGAWGIYELLPAFIVSCIFIVVVSLATKEPDADIQSEFDAAKAEASKH